MTARRVTMAPTTVALVLALTGCECASEATGPEPPGEQSSSAEEPAPNDDGDDDDDEPSAEATPPDAGAAGEEEERELVVDTARVRQYAADVRGHLRDGRLHVRAHEWDEAVADFEQALALDPSDGRVRCELGFVHLRAEQLTPAAAQIDRALLDLTRAHTVQSDSIGACLYNRGRVHEALGDSEHAATYYRKSLELRPHRVVEERLASLAGPPAEGEVAPPDLDALVTEAALRNATGEGSAGAGGWPSQQAALVALGREACAEHGACADAIDQVAGWIAEPSADAIVSAQVDTRDLPGEPSMGRASLVRIDVHGSLTYTLIHEHRGVVRRVGHVLSVFNPGMLGITQDGEASIQQAGATADGQAFVVVRTKHRGRDIDMGLDEEERFSERRVAVYGVDEGALVPWAMLVTSYSFSRDAMGMAQEGEEAPAHEGIPILYSFERTVRVEQDQLVVGDATEGESKGSAPAPSRPPSGRFPLAEVPETHRAVR